ncbi:ATP-dependent DNA helicase PIF1 [Fusarium oxysporum f. sp. raphani]|uniref:ATP-dependent DNA helicase n=1 Tax=Fusarium oxysporum f. sp. raphani TaxID=96318 RepID=A0A8J5PFK2_FUSOX|nr:ATP-dependent DNA helicase PIF1 [Fusarium oxysporum f. sp. raphani]
MEVHFGASTSFLEAGKALVARFTLNKRQAIAFLILCRQLDLIHRGEKREKSDISQLCQFVGGEGGTGKSRVIEALVELFASKGISNRLLITATSGTAAARINGITIHSACGFSKDQAAGANLAKDLDGVRLPKQAERFVHGQSRMDWQDKAMLVIDEVSMLGARTLYAVNEQLCRLRGSQQDFGGIPIVLFCGDFHQFRPVQERSILLPSMAVSWDEDNSFKAEQRHQHNKAHALWKKFTTVVMLDEQVRAAGDPVLQRLLKRIRLGVQDRTDLELLNSRCYREDRRIPWETGITVVTPLNRNRWNLNMEATLAFQILQRSIMRIFISEHKWKDGLPTEEEAIMMLNQGDDSAIPVPAIFMFVPGIPVVVNHNTHQGLKLVNGASYTALEVILDETHPGHRISADMMVHFGPPAGIILESETTKDIHFVGMPSGTVLLTPMSVRIQCQRKRPWQCNDVSRKGQDARARSTGVARDEDDECRRTHRPLAVRPVQPVRERDLVGNRVPPEMTAAQARLEELSNRTIREAMRWLDDDSQG